MKKLLINKEHIDLLTLNATPIELIFSNGFSGFTLSDGTQILGFCANCSNPKCLKYSDNELDSSVFKSFPHNTSNRVCPTNAIRRDEITNRIIIDHKHCINCGLCLYRCPYAAIQYDTSHQNCQINYDSIHSRSSTKDEQESSIHILSQLPRKILFNNLTKEFSHYYLGAIKKHSLKIPDISEIIVRNTLLNFGNICNTNAPGNNHIRIEFFAESGDKIIIGESGITNTDTLEISRRILDDLAVLINRYGFNKDTILPLSVVNGLPNKRTDYYEVIEDIQNVLNIQIRTITYHILYLLNLFNLKITANELSNFIINRTNNDLLPYVEALIPDIKEIDENTGGNNFTPTK